MGMQPRHAISLDRSIFRVRSTDDSSGSNGQFEECVVHHTDSKGLYFTRPMYDKNKTVYGPAPYAWPLAGVTGATAVSTFGTHTHTEPVPSPAPVAGNRVLIAWVAAFTGGVRPWALGWSSS